MKRLWIVMKLMALLAVILASIAIGIIFAHDNSHPLSVNLLGYRYELTVGVWLLLSFSVGILVAWCLSAMIWLLRTITFSHKK